MASVNGVSILASKFRGCMVGSLLGDCLGAPFEGDSVVSKSVLTNYLTKLMIDGPSGGAVQVHSYTDDTAMTLSVAKSLIEKKAFDPIDMARKFVVEFYNQPRRGYGMHVVDVFNALKKTDYSDVFAPAKNQFNGGGSYGNGASMRIAPIALFCYNNKDLLVKVAENSSQITHAHQNGYNGAILQCLAVYQALKSDSTSGIDPVHFVSNLLENMENIEKEREDVSDPFEEKRPFCESLNKMKELFDKKHKDITSEEIAALLGNNISAHRSVPTAIYSFLRSLEPLSTFKHDNPFVRTLFLSISVGGDTDTIAAMAGSIAGAYHGIEVIPKALQKRCEGLDESLQLADQLLKVSDI